MLLPLPPLASLCETVKFLLQVVAELTNSEEVAIRVSPDREALGYGGGKFYDFELSSRSKGGIVLIPLRTGGWLALREVKKSFDRDVLEQYCSQALENAAKYEYLQSQSMVDALTGLPNRVALYRKLDEEVKRLCKFCVLFMDLNGFKNVNDTYGHLTGDDVLRQAAKEIRNSLRASDFLARYGGDEFVAVLSETTGEKGKVVVSRVKGRTVRVGEASVSVSVGMAIYPEDGQTAEELIRCADQRMYADKKKNRRGL